MRQSRTPIILPSSGTQLFIADVPEIAVREAVVNAVMHRDHRVRGPIQVEHSPDWVSVRSPGGFVNGVGVDNLLVTKSTTRNAALVNALRLLNLGEAAGVGVDRMVADMLRYGHRPPSFETDGGYVMVTLRGGRPNNAWTVFVAGLPVEIRDDPNAMIVLTRLLAERTVDGESLSAALLRDDDAAESVLRTMTNVEPATASRYLGDLVEREVLVKTSTASRGPSVAYGKGPKFPRTKRGSRTRGTTPSTKQQQEMTVDE
ncbi:MAG: hypothetical protein L0H79_14585 [Intrasporangium sp.]|uniref:ATP-binding protein n=1 Tax=Intrasporangium sp. TaxID=1925024 RepID=UPI002648443A|nr:ATP-binding protein [Intrasporangium sp.]MDN5796969.1 hypothetical protein [Intrasporangium sp.]